MSDTPKKSRKPYSCRIGKLDLENVLTDVPLPSNRSHHETTRLKELFRGLTTVGQCFVLPFTGTSDNLRGVKRRVSGIMTAVHRKNPDCRMILRALKGLDNKDDKVTHIGVWRIK